ncbi:MAG: Fic family protein [Chloroflexi bacterium]|nr:Fic family protein [Chloroflexota bacterium]
MDPKNFSSSSSGTPILTQTGYWAFLPAPLAPVITWSLPLVSALADAERDLSKLTTMAGSFPFPRLLIQPFVRREAVLSSRIEGTRATLTDLYAYESAQLSFLEPGNDVREVYNYVRALEYGLERVKTLPVSLRLIREIHAKLMDGVRGGNLTPGEFRRSDLLSKSNWIGSIGSTPATAAYVPPPVDEMNAGLDQLEKFIHAGSEIPALVRAGLVHYQFEAIHPFLDGNGRIGRLLMILLLGEWNLLPQPLLNLSVYFERYRQEYYDLLLSVSQKGNWESWLRFFLRGVSVQASDSVVRLNRLQTMRTIYQAIADTERNRMRMEQVLDFLFMQPVLSVRQLQTFLNVSFPIAQRYIDRLVDAGVLQEVTGQSRNRIFRANEIFQALEGLE